MTTHSIEMWTLVFSFLEPRELCAVALISHEFRTASAARSLWWHHCMTAWFDAEHRPMAMSAKDRKRDWRQQFFDARSIRLQVAEDALRRPVVGPSERRAAREARWVEENAVRGKVEMRELYKSDRSALRSKMMRKRDGVTAAGKEADF